MRTILFSFSTAVLIFIFASTAVSGEIYYVPTFNNSSSYWTGIAMTDLGHDENNDAYLWLYDKSGKFLGQEKLTMSSEGQVSGFVGTSYGLNKVGSFRVHSDAPLKGLAFLGHPDGVMADIPFIENAYKKLVVPHCAQNNEWDTILYLQNAENDDGTVTIRVETSSGSYVGGTNRSIDGYGALEIPVSGMIGSSTVHSGSISIECTTELAGFALYTSLKNGSENYAGIAAEPVIEFPDCPETDELYDCKFTDTKGTTMYLSKDQDISKWIFLRGTYYRSGENDGTAYCVYDKRAKTATFTLVPDPTPYPVEGVIGIQTAWEGEQGPGIFTDSRNKNAWEVDPSSTTVTYEGTVYMGK